MRVMIIDDDEAWTRSLSILFAQHGDEVLVFNDPVKACEYVDAAGRKKSELPDAVVLDYHMPEMSGFQVLGWIWDSMKDDCLVAFVTGHGEQMQNAKLHEMGVAACLEKPVDFDELVQVLEGEVAA